MSTPDDSIPYADTIDFSLLNDAQLFVLARLAQLKANDFGPYLPRWVVELPLAENPFKLDAAAIAETLVSLATIDLLAVEDADEGSADDANSPSPVERHDGSSVEHSAESTVPPSSSDTQPADTNADVESKDDHEIQIAAADRCMQHIEALRAEVARRAPQLPTDTPALLLLADANRQPAGFDSQLIMQALEDPPACLARSEGVDRYRALMDAYWLFAVERDGHDPEWFPSPATWAHEQQLLQLLSDRGSEIRPALADGISNHLDFAAESPLRAALHAIDRAHFIPPAHRVHAYRNRPVPIWHDVERGSFITTSSPAVCAMIASTLELSLGDRVLVCGVKGGFTASLCAHLVGPRGRVVCLEDRAEIVEFARDAIDRTGFSRRIDIRLVRDVTLGLDDQEPWDAVVVNGKIPKVPRPIIRQMRDGGRMLLFLQNVEDNAQTAYLVRKNGAAVEHKAMSTFSFTPLYGEYGFDPPNWQDNLNLVGQEGHEVFISYSTKDQRECHQLVAALEEAGIRCWMSGRDHPVGRDGYESAIMTALQRSKLFVIILSHHSVGSDHVKNEITNATDLRKVMLPVRLEECPMRLPNAFQYHLGRHQQFDLAEHSLERIASAALQLLERRPPRAADATTNAYKPPEPRSEQVGVGENEFDETIRFVLRDGRITKSEYLLVIEEARRHWPTLHDLELRERIVQRAQHLNPEVQFEF